VQTVCGGRYLRYQRPLCITEAELHQYEIELHDLYRRGVLQVRHGSPVGKLYSFAPAAPSYTESVAVQTETPPEHAEVTPSAEEATPPSGTAVSAPEKDVPEGERPRFTAMTKPQLIEYLGALGQLEDGLQDLKRSELVKMASNATAA